jgi:hypothetical protein
MSERAGWRAPAGPCRFHGSGLTGLHRTAMRAVRAGILGVSRSPGGPAGAAAVTGRGPPCDRRGHALVSHDTPLTYDPLQPPDAAGWLARSERDRLDAVQRFHRTVGATAPRERLHAVVHVIVESQIALGDETPVEATIRRLMGEGLDRHEALHAIGSVLVQQMTDVLHGHAPASEPTAEYYRLLAALTADRWRATAEIVSGRSLR